ncbi:MAG: ATP-binding protein [Hungatella sp.]|nr:ATP-binding protein [Hungatella sp.]
MHWKLKVWEYGKIGSAEIEAAPLTLFVGDNNSGKSYLMSLLWGIQNFGVKTLIDTTKEQDLKEEYVVMDWVRSQVTAAWKTGSSIAFIGEIANELQAVLDRRLKRNKDKLIQRIFNSQTVKIKDLQIELIDLDKVSLKIASNRGIDKTEGHLIWTSDRVRMIGMPFSDERLELLKDTFDWFIFYLIFSMVLEIDIGDTISLNQNIYLPASRTGFMLTKDIINKVGRNTAFNIELESERLSPFTRPVNQFLDVMDDLTLEERGSERFKDITEYLESGMAEGTLELSTLPNREVSYIPSGQTEGLPLRTVSAVVTELSPLILILKHKRHLNTIFYEEPEMCLHPQLQQKMGKVICELVNNRLNLIVTTHSDLILQHINNMIRLARREDKETLCRQFGYKEDDLLRAEQVKVYQLKSQADGESSVEELLCGENGFAIPSFNDALDRIMDEAYTIQE